VRTYRDVALVGIVCGSGLGLTSLLDEVVREQPFNAIPGLAPGHGYTFVHGLCGPCPIIIQRGRLHMYEGLGYEAVVQTVDAMHRFGVRVILFTNVAGGLLPEMPPGDLLAVKQLKLWRYAPWPSEPETISTDFLVPGCEFTGTYYWMHGPCYETRAEIGALQKLGASAVGMSTAPELARCHELGIRAGVISCITNSCCRPQALTHDHVIAMAQNSSEKLAGIIRNAMPQIARDACLS